MKRILPIAAALLPLVAGCVTNERVRPPEAVPPTAYTKPQPSAGSLPTAALDDWWKLYRDEQLDKLVAQALTSAPDQKDAFARLEQAAAIRRGTLDQLYLPSGAITGSGTRTYTNIINGGAAGFGGGGGFVSPGATDDITGSFNVSWELDLFGRRPAGRRTADADFYTAAFTYEATRTSLIANVAQSLFQARGIALQLADAEETAHIAHELERITRVKAEHGLGTQGDADQSAASAKADDAQVQNLKAQLDDARRTLLVLVGKGFDPLESLPAAPVMSLPPAVPATAPGDLLRRRPDVREAEWRIVSAAGTLKTDELALLPTIKLQPGATITKTTGPFGLTDAAWSIGAGLTQPVLDRPRLIEQIHAQHAVAEEDVVAYEKAVQQAYSDAENAFNDLASDTLRVEILTDAEHRARSAYDAARIGFARGVTDLTATLQAETTWRSTRLQLTNAQTTLMERSVQLFKALGGGWTPDQPAASTHYAAKAEQGAAKVPLAAVSAAAAKGGE
jgi:NodT family efflux transporter outer membrane factor (OMF) lipoprotein